MFAGFMAWWTLSWSPTPMIPLQTHNWPHQTRLRSQKAHVSHVSPFKLSKVSFKHTVDSSMDCTVYLCIVYTVYTVYVCNMYVICVTRLCQGKVWAWSHWCTCDHSENLRGQVPGLKLTRYCQFSCQGFKYLMMCCDSILQASSIILLHANYKLWSLTCL